MQKVSRSLLLAGVLAFGTFVAACGDKVTVAAPTPGQTGVFSVTVSPSNATINVGTTIQLAASVSADASTAKTVAWTTSNAGVATVDATGKVTGVAAGTVTVTATATADASKASAAAITVVAPTVPITVPPSIAINSVTTSASGISVPVNLSNVAGQIDITVNTSGGGLIEVFLSSSCATNTISSTDVAVASQQATSAQAGSVTLSVNTAQLTAANVPLFPNGNYCVKARLTNGATKVVATNTVPLTLNNINVFKATLAFASQTGGPTTAVSSINGLNYNQGTATVTITPIIFTGSSPAALISGYFTRNGEQNSAGSPGNAAFTNVAVTSGTATIAMTDTGSSAGVRSIFAYQSLPAGDTLYITSITDASGNPITVTPTPGFPAFSVAGVQGVRIDNDAPTLAGSYTVTAPNGYIGAAYSFASGTGAPASTDVKGTVTPPGAAAPGVPGVGGITTTYYVGAAGSAPFTGAPGSCSTSGLIKAAVGTDLPNTTTIAADQAKVVVSDALGNSICAIVPVTTVTGSPVTFGVDKIAPIASMTTANNGASDSTGYAVSKNFSVIYNDSISGFNAATPLTGTLKRNFYTSGASADCLIGSYSATTKLCSNVPITVTSNFGAPPTAGGSVEFATYQAPQAGAADQNGYYTFTAFPVDRALNPGATIRRDAAFDNGVPTVATPTQSPAAATPLGTVTVTAGATDALNLWTDKGRLIYNPAGGVAGTTTLTFASVTGTPLGAYGTFNTSATATIALPAPGGALYRGIQSVDAGGKILANTAPPTATITVTNIASTAATSAPLTIATSSAATNVFSTADTLTLSSSVGAAPATTQSSTTLTVRVLGQITDPAFQSQPFAQIDFYKLNGAGELAFVSSVSAASVTDLIATGQRYYTYIGSVPLTAASTNTLYAIARTSAGDAVVAAPFAIVNP